MMSDDFEYRGLVIEITVDELADRTFSVTPWIRQSTGDGERLESLYCETRTFDTAEAARSFGLQQAKRTIDEKLAP